MRDIRNDLIERIDTAKKVFADANELYQTEIKELKAKLQSEVQRYETEIDQLKSLLALECERESCAIQKTIPLYKASPPDHIKKISVEKPANPITSTADAERRLKELSILVRRFQENAPLLTNVHQLTAHSSGQLKVG